MERTKNTNKEVNLLLINTVRWRIPKENSQKQFELWREMLDYQRSHPEKFHYVRSRFYRMTEEDSSEEHWMAIDDYEKREDFDKTMKIFSEDPECIRMSEEFFGKCNPLIVSKSQKNSSCLSMRSLLRTKLSWLLQLGSK